MPKGIVKLIETAAAFNEVLDWSSYSNIGILVDDHTYTKCYPLIKNYIPAHSIIIVPPGEEHKNLDTCKLIWQHLTDLNFDRHSLLLILGEAY